MIRFGIIGTNFITDWFMAGASHDPRFALTAVYSRREETARQFIDKCRTLYGPKIGNIEIFTDMASFVASDSYDAAYVASPNLLHHSQTISLIHSGKHVLCEKPMGTNLAQTREMAEAAISGRVVLMEALKTTLMPNFAAVRDNLDRIGTIRRYFSQYCQYSSRYDKLKEGVVLNAFDPRMAGGALLDLGIYCIYPLVALLGRPLTVLSDGLLLDSGVDGQGSLICGYDGFDAVIMYSKISDSALPSEIQGELGSIVIERINNFPSVKICWRDGRQEDISRPTCEDNMYHEVAEFLDLVERSRMSGANEQSAVNSLQTTLWVAELMEGVRKRAGVKYPSDR